MNFSLTSNGLAALVMIAAVTYYLLMEHQEHVLQALPYLIFLLCPLMHLFMHRGYGGGCHPGKGHDEASDNEDYRQGLEEGRRQSQERKHRDDGR